MCPSGRPKGTPLGAVVIFALLKNRGTPIKGARAGKIFLSAFKTSLDFKEKSRQTLG
jgi:hypothetical protein